MRKHARKAIIRHRQLHDLLDPAQMLQLRPVQQEGPKLQKIWVEGGIFEEKARVLLQCSSWRQVHIVRQLATFS